MNQTRRRNRGSCEIGRGGGGFNAAELLIVVAIVAILSAISLPLLNNVIARNRLEGAAWKIGGDLRYTQSLAVSRGGLFRLNSATAACTTVSGQTRYRIQQSTDGGTNWTPFTECYLLSSEFQGAVLASIAGSPGGPLTEVRFNSRGVCTSCTGGGVTPPIVFTVSSGFGTRTVQVRPTGSVSIQ